MGFRLYKSVKLALAFALTSPRPGSASPLELVPEHRHADDGIPLQPHLNRASARTPMGLCSMPA
jgi:hypothetical protein